MGRDEHSDEPGGPRDRLSVAAERLPQNDPCALRPSKGRSRALAAGVGRTARFENGEEIRKASALPHFGGNSQQIIAPLHSGQRTPGRQGGIGIFKRLPDALSVNSGHLGKSLADGWINHGNGCLTTYPFTIKI